MIQFVSHNKKIDGFLKMGRLIGFLQSDAEKDEKIAEIKAARTNGLISDDEALELTIEFC